ncbi:hypothetical protein M6B38_147020 [Iris pallida]|uniref:Uncharacterized protein n=1 Tax=Iris pallida TaxID=29817 RepID=A0AAX6F995_IRIPA|nr:hypothetical protein M6B38_147020 [Iris pallida]
MSTALVRVPCLCSYPAWLYVVSGAVDWPKLRLKRLRSGVWDYG